MDDYVTKPLVRDELTMTLARVCDSRAVVV